MSLLNKIRAAQPEPTSAPTLAPVQQSLPDNVIDIDVRDQMLAAIAAAPLHPTHAGGIATLLAISNRATLDAATKIAYRLATAELQRRYGKAEPEMKTAADWNRESIHQKREPETVKP